MSISPVFPLPLTSNHPIQVEEKLEGSENEMGEKPREPSQVTLSSVVLEFEAPGAGREKAVLSVVLVFEAAGEVGEVEEVGEEEGGGNGMGGRDQLLLS